MANEERSRRKTSWIDFFRTINDIAQSRGAGSKSNGHAPDGAHGTTMLSAPNASATREVLVLREAPLFDAPRATTPIPMHTLVRIGVLSLMVVVAAAMASAGFAMTRPTVRGAEIDVIYEPSTEATSSVQLDRELQTQEVIIRSRSVVGPVAAAQHISVDKLGEALSVEVLPGTEVLRLTVADRHASKARRIAQRIADTYIDLATGSTEHTLTTKLASLRTQLTDLQQRAQTAQFQGQSTNAKNLQQNADDVLKQINDVRTKLASLAPPGKLHGTPRTLAAAHVLSSPLFPRPARAAAVGALLGMFIAAAMALVLLRRRSV